MPGSRNETNIRKKIIQRLKTLGAKVIIAHVDQFALKGTPDLIGCYRSVALAIEVKDPNGDAPTVHQRRQIDEWGIAGAQTAVLTSASEVDIIVEKVNDWLGCLYNGYIDTRLEHFESPNTPIDRVPMTE